MMFDRAPLSVLTALKTFGVHLLQVQSHLRKHVGQDVQFPPYWGRLFPLCRGLHQWIYQHFRVSVLVCLWADKTPYTTATRFQMSLNEGVSGKVPLCRIHNEKTVKPETK